ncbi:MAG TPA: hypothetical protein VHS78_08360 [Candidatus Elarobacter sp.]|nr:hypothetical protein [Candidatus Elarobacter sp.]
MRIAVSSSTFRRPLAAGELTQLEWLERCASVLGADGVLAAVEDFPRRDAEYVAQLRKVAVDLGLVPFGLDAPGLLEPGGAAEREPVLALATGFGALVVRTTLPTPGEVPPATFVETMSAAKGFAKLAKAANVTLLVGPAPGTIAEDLSGVKHLVKDVDSAWLRACPAAVSAGEAAPKDRYPAFTASAADDLLAVASRASRAWVILDAAPAERPWDAVRDALCALRSAEAEAARIAGR